MSLPPDKMIADLFASLDPAGMKARSRQDRESALLQLHGLVATRYADAAFLRLTSAPDFVDGSVTGPVMSDRLGLLLDDLIAQGAASCRSHGFNEDLTRLQGEARLVKGFFHRIYDLTLFYQRGHA